MTAAASLFLFTAQMPGWKPCLDREGNRYFLDNNGKIIVTIDHARAFIPVSSKGIEYNLGLADEFIRAHRKADALTIWKSILRLNPESAGIIEAQKNSTKKITSLAKREAERFTEINEEASHLFIDDGKGVLFADDLMRYSIRFEGDVYPVRKSTRKKQDYAYRGITIGVRIDKKNKSKNHSYDYLAAADCEKFKVNIKGIAPFEEYRLSVEGKTTLDKKIIRSDENIRVYEFANRIAPEYSGYEILCASGRYGIIIRLITPTAKFAANKDSMKKAVESFRHVAER